MASCLIKKQQGRPAVQRARQHQALALTAGQSAAHVANQAVITHGHTGDVFVNGR
jgi:hypothetical protein